MPSFSITVKNNETNKESKFEYSYMDKIDSSISETLKKEMFDVVVNELKHCIDRTK